ncbi:MAG: exosortase E/protease, VPEID-CTERM system [Pseudomonadota bacterium]
METVGSVSRFPRLKLLILIAIAELFAVVVVYQLLASIECRLTDMETACRALRSMTARGLAFFAFVSLFFWIRPASYRLLSDFARNHPGRRHWLVLHLVGLILIFLPLPFFGADGIMLNIAETLTVMVLGGILAAAGGFFWTTAATNWFTWLRSDGYLLPLVLLGALVVPDLADLMQPLWGLQILTDVTFVLVALTLSAISPDVWADLSVHAIGMEGFIVRVGRPCSGVEGIALITVFMALYSVLMRGTIRQGRYWFVFYPLALLTSWLFNVIRIAALIVVGARISPEHAVNGFHSYAGWLMFTLLSLAILVILHRSRWLQTANIDDPSPRVPFGRDEIAASILPFVVMMVSGVIAAAFWVNPEDGYPMRVILMGLTLACFTPYLLSLSFKLNVADLGTGLCVGLAWVAFAGPAGDSGSAPDHTVLWIILRLVGTILLVPVIEELFFRGYVLRRLDRGGWAWRVAAIAISSLLFGILHDRVVAGVGAGLIFSALMLRTNRVESPIVAHMTANAVVAASAVLISDFSLL